MQRRRNLQRKFDSPNIVWPTTRALVLLGLLIGMYLSPTTLAAGTKRLPIDQTIAQQPAANDENAAVKIKVETVGEQRLKKRLISVAIVGGVMLLLLAFGYGYLRLELITRGFYSGRLQIAAGIASILTLTAAYFMWLWLVN